jgi:iron complex outermembrane recepter protein
MNPCNGRLAGAVRTAVRGTLCSAVFFSPLAVLAQGSQDLETVYVTGSRIARASDFENPSPVVSFNQEELARSGYTNLQQLLEKQPFVGSGTFSTRGNNQDSSANGASGISLRGLGADATLVLVNGRRVAISSFAESITTNFVDINTIPVAAIERLEVLKDGASAVYGADAVAGVINVILRKDFEGFEVAAGYGGTTESGMDETTLSGIWGLNGEDSNVTLILDYYKSSTLMNKERGYFGTANQSPRGGQDFRSSRGFPGRFIVDGVTTIDPACPEGSRAGQTCVYDFGPWNLLAPEAERSGMMLLGRMGVGAGIELFTEIGVQHNTSIAQGAPTPLDESAGLTVPVTHPNNPYPGATSLGVGRYRTVDAGPRQWDIETDNLRMVLGLRGQLDRWTWEVAAQRGRSESEQTGDRSQGWVRTDFLQTEIDAGRYNPFGGVQNPQSVIDAITTNLVRRGKSDLTSFDAQLSGDVFTMPAGAVGMAVGLEYRDEKVSDIPDDQFQRGLIFGTEAVSAAASRDNWSAFVEFAVPLLDTLELSLAARYDDYSDFGDTTNPKIALRWEPLESLALRASWGTGFRAPSLAQIGLGPSQESLFFTDTYGCADNPAYCPATDYNIVFAGNPDLQPEESENYNLGVAWRPLEGLQLSVDYWDIEQEDKIDDVAFGYIYTQFCGVQDSTVCVRGTPLPGDTLGPLQSVNSGFVNIGEQSVTGIDFSVLYSTPLAAGELTVGLDYSRLLEFEKVELNADGTAFVRRELTGEYEFPEDRFVLTGDWSTQDWGLFGAVNYIGEFEDTPDIDFDGTLDYDTNRSRTVDAFITVNFQARYTGFEGLTIAVGLDNAFDEKPPFAIGDGDGDLYGYVSSQHDPRGRFAYGKVTYRF